MATLAKDFTEKVNGPVSAALFQVELALPQWVSSL